MGFASICFAARVLCNLLVTSINILCRLLNFVFLSINLVKDEIKLDLSSSSPIRSERKSGVDDLDALVSSSFCFFSIVSLIFLSFSSFYSFSFLFFSSSCFFFSSRNFSWASSTFLFSSSNYLFSSSINFN